MSQPYSHTSHDEVSSAGPGDEWMTKGHNSLGLGIIASNLSPSTDTLEARLEVYVGDDENGGWAPVRNPNGNLRGELVAGDLYQNDDGDYVGFLYIHGVPSEKVRVNITGFTDNASNDLVVSTFVSGTGNAGGKGTAYQH